MVMSKIKVMFMTAPSMLYTGSRKLDGIIGLCNVRKLSNAAVATAVVGARKRILPDCERGIVIHSNSDHEGQMKFAGGP